MLILQALTNALQDVVPQGGFVDLEGTLHRWDRRVPTSVRDYLDEVRRTRLPWLTHPRRMLRHKALVQCARLAFGLVGIHDHDEAQRFLDARRTHRMPQAQPPQSAKANSSSKEMGVKAVMARLDLE